MGYFHLAHILVVDQGTTSTRAAIVDSNGSIVASEFILLDQHFPNTLWIEHDPEQLYNSVVSVIKKVIHTAKLKPKDLSCLGITNQRETTLIWNKKTHKPIYNAIVWQDRRTESLINSFKKLYNENDLRKKTGLLFDPYFSASKIAWLLDHFEEVKKNPDDYLFGTIESFLVYKLTGGELHISDVTNASRTLLFNIQTLKWDETLLDLFKIPRQILPKIVSNSETYGKVSTLEEIKDLPITSLIGDQQAALFGQGCFEEKQAKCTYGTGCFVLMNTGQTPVYSGHRLLTTIGYQLNGKTTYAIEGSVFMGGATVQWLRDELHFFENSKDIEKLASTVKDSRGVILVPSFTGLGAPYWIPNATGLLLGLTRGTTQAHIARAALQSIAFQVCDIFEAIYSDLQNDKLFLKVDGGATDDLLLMQMQSDYLQTTVEISKYKEVTALGAAFLAGLGIGIWKSLDELKPLIKTREKLTPIIDSKTAQNHIAIWKDAIECTKYWAKFSEKRNS